MKVSGVPRPNSPSLAIFFALIAGERSNFGEVTQEMLTSGSVERVAWVEGAGKSSPEAPQENLTGDPWFTDGLRVVLFLSNETVPPSAVHFDDWRTAPQSNSR